MYRPAPNNKPFKRTSVPILSGVTSYFLACFSYPSDSRISPDKACPPVETAVAPPTEMTASLTRPPLPLKPSDKGKAVDIPATAPSTAAVLNAVLESTP